MGMLQIGMLLFGERAWSRLKLHDSEGTICHMRYCRLGMTRCIVFRRQYASLSARCTLVVPETSLNTKDAMQHIAERD